MHTDTVSRRNLLRGAGATAGAVAATGLGAAVPAAASPDMGLEGSWLATRQDDGSTMHVRLVLSFAGGGVFLSHDIEPEGPPFTGTWARGGSGWFSATFWTGQPGANGAPGPTIRVRARGRLVGDRLSGTYRLTVFAPGGGTVLQRGTGTFSGHRIEA